MSETCEGPLLSLSSPRADVFVPDERPLGEALARTTHLGVGAHQDDLELMAAHGIEECFGSASHWFTGVVVTDGAGSPRGFAYREHSDSQMQELRRLEQRRAATLGGYSLQLQLAHASASVKAAERGEVVADLTEVLRRTRPAVVYTHNLADKHDTHVAVTLRLLQACRALAVEERPLRVIGCEVWRDLDWLVDADKLAMPVDRHEALHPALLGVFESQIVGGKRYDLAALGRRHAHATFAEVHALDASRAVIWGMDLTPLMTAEDPAAYVSGFVRRLEEDVVSRIRALSSRS